MTMLNQLTPGDLVLLTGEMRKLGVRSFSLGDVTVRFRSNEALPEKPQKFLTPDEEILLEQQEREAIRKELDAELYGAS